MNEYEAAIDDWLERAHDDLTGIGRQSIQTLCFRVMSDTNVDTGFLRGSWQPTFEPPPMMKAEKDQNVSLDPSGALGMAALAVVLQNLKLGDTFYYSNGCVYAKRIEYGFVGYDSLGRYYNQAGHYFMTNNVAQWGDIVQMTAGGLT